MTARAGALFCQRGITAARATNRWRLSVVVEDKAGQRVSSNEITLALTQPLLAYRSGSALGAASG